MSDSKKTNSRRQFLGTAGLVGAGAVLASCAPVIASVPTKQNIDPAVLNFALNLEYLEAAFYLAAVGRLGDLTALGGGSAAIILPTGTNSSQPAFTGAYSGGMTFNTDVVKAYAQEIAQDEYNHVKFLRTALGSAAVDRPVLDIGPAFANAAIAATGSQAAATFSPYTTETSADLYFLHGAFIFEDVGVTAYNGAATLITSSAYLQAAASILAVEAYHAGLVRTVLFRNRASATGYGVNVAQLIAAISALRAKVGGGADQGITSDGTATGSATIVPVDSNSLAYARTTSQVLAIVYLGDATKPGGFFPNGLNGTIK